MSASMQGISVTMKLGDGEIEEGRLGIVEGLLAQIIAATLIEQNGSNQAIPQGQTHSVDKTLRGAAKPRGGPERAA